MSSGNELFQSTTYFKLDRAFFIRMLDLEKCFHDRSIQIKQISELVGQYARCVEYYDSIKDSSKYYYVDKIQYVISRKESLEQIFKDQQPPGMQQGVQNDSKLPKDLTISDFVIDFNFNQQDNNNPGEMKISGIKCSIFGANPVKQPQPKKEIIIEEAEEEPMPIMRESVKRRKEQNEYKMNVAIYGMGDGNGKEAKTIVNETQKQFEKNDQIIKEDISNQEKEMMERIAKKKAKLNQLKKKALLRANSFDQEELNMATKEEKEKEEKQIENQEKQQTNLKVVEENAFGRISIAVKHNEDENSDQKGVQEEQLQKQQQKKKEEISDLKETFDMEYNKLFTSINQLNKSQQMKQSRQFQYQQKDQQQIKPMEIIAEARDTLTQSSVANDISTEGASKQSQQIAQTEEDLQTLISGRITLGNPYEEDDDDDDEE